MSDAPSLSVRALAKFLKVNVEEVEETSWNTFECEGDEYMVLSDSEATEKARSYILDSVWAFNASFLASYTHRGIDEEVVRMIQDNGKCESNNDKLRGLIDDEDSFVEDAIATDGRAHFLNTYDGEEHEITMDGETLYIYRMS